ncbi:MAG: anti-sigma factor [Sphingomicrobium sp.]
MTDERGQTSDAAAMAAEHALGLVTGNELRAARARAASEPNFAAEVARWRGRLAPLHEETECVTPPPELWRRIEFATIGRSASNDNVAILRRKLVVWRSATGALIAVAASLALVVSLQLRPAPAPQPRVQQPAAVPMVAMLGDKRSIKVVASWDPAARQLVLAVPGQIPADTAHSRELWVIPTGGKPRSLGTMGAAKQMHLQLADALADLLQHGATIAISIEPPEGSPTGAPTGPVIASGPLTKA